MFRLVRLMGLVFGSIAVSAAASRVSAEPVPTPVPSLPAPAAGTTGQVPSGIDNPIIDLRKANADYKRAEAVNAQARTDTGTATVEQMDAVEAVQGSEDEVNKLVGKLPPTAPVPETKEYVGLKIQLLAASVALGNAKTKQADADSKVKRQILVERKSDEAFTAAAKDLSAKAAALSDAVGKGTAPEASAFPHLVHALKDAANTLGGTTPATFAQAAKSLSEKADALLNAIDDAEWPSAFSPPICLALPRMPGGCPSDISHPWSSQAAASCREISRSDLQRTRPQPPKHLAACIRLERI
jgi:uncharacterized phage infection (PIP) family protein YhgE